MRVKIENIIAKKGNHQKQEWKDIYNVKFLQKGYRMELETDERCLSTSKVCKINFYSDRNMFLVETLNTIYELKIIEW